MARDVGNLKLRLMSLKCGDLPSEEWPQLFADLIHTGKAWSSGEMVANIAQGMLDNKQITQEGIIVKSERVEDGKGVNQESNRSVV